VQHFGKRFAQDALDAPELTAIAPAPARGNGSELRRIERILCETLAEVLYMKVADIGVRTAFVDLGMDSVMGVEWLPMIQQELGVALGATKIYEYPTLSELAVFVLSQLPSTALEAAPPAQQRSIDEWLQAIYDGTASPDDAPHWLQVQHAASAGGRHAH
ncbi:acyl carrier protein, partial [Xanthomonas sp. BRIP62409]|uniref:acyl carrier protein n=1 Tax=Xanthomonas sp. BRIP62409 TaxID=2182388 RepID=UPI0013E0BAB1